MLVVGSKLLGFPVLSLHVGGEVARTRAPIIDPEGLKIIGYEIEGPLVRGDVGDIMDVADVREYSNRGLIVDSTDEFVVRGDVVRMDKVMGLNFRLVGLKVETVDGRNLGKVADYTIDTDSFVVFQLIVKRPVMKAFLDPELTINRSQIVEVDDYKVVVKNEDEKVKVPAKKAAKDFKPNFVNPFREPAFEPSRSRSPGGQDTE